MGHFASIGLNSFRLPVSWQYLVNNNLGGPLDPTNSGRYDQLVQGCLQTGAHCIIDIHNYARWNGEIVDQSGGAVTGAQLNSLWQQLYVLTDLRSFIDFADNREGLLNTQTTQTSCLVS